MKLPERRPAVKVVGRAEAEVPEAAGVEEVVEAEDQAVRLLEVNLLRQLPRSERREVDEVALVDEEAVVEKERAAEEAQVDEEARLLPVLPRLRSRVLRARGLES